MGTKPAKDPDDDELESYILEVVSNSNESQEETGKEKNDDHQPHEPKGLAHDSKH